MRVQERDVYHIWSGIRSKLHNFLPMGVHLHQNYAQLHCGQHVIAINRLSLCHNCHALKICFWGNLKGLNTCIVWNEDYSKKKTFVAIVSNK